MDESTPCDNNKGCGNSVKVVYIRLPYKMHKFSFCSLPCARTHASWSVTSNEDVAAHLNDGGF